MKVAYSASASASADSKGKSFADIMGLSVPHGPNVPSDKWLGKGYYRVHDAWDGSPAIVYAHNPADLAGPFFEVDSFTFIAEDVPARYRKMAKSAWRGEGDYSVLTSREIAWSEDKLWVGYASSWQCLADGLFRAFYLEEILGVRKSTESDSENAERYFDCPDKLHGEIVM